MSQNRASYLSVQLNVHALELEVDLVKLFTKPVLLVCFISELQLLQTTQELDALACAIYMLLQLSRQYYMGCQYQ